MSIKPQVQTDRSRIFIAAMAGVVLLRLVVWKIFPLALPMVKEDFSNLIVAVFQLAFGAAFAALALQKRVKVPVTGFEPALGILLLASSVSLCYTLDFSVTLRVWVPLMGSMVMFYILTGVLTTMERVKVFLYFILACAFVTSLYGLQEFAALWTRPPQPGDADIAEYNASLYYILLNRRVTSFLGWPNSLAGYLLLILPFAGLSILTVRRLWARFILGGITAVLIGCLLVTFSFLGWLNFLIATVILMPVMLKRFLPRLDRRGKVLLGLLAAVFCALFLVVIMRKNFAGSIVPRLEYYSQAWHLIAARPWEGYGFGTFGLAARPMVESMDAFTNYTHNIYLQWWVECGVLGLAGILWLIGVFIVASRRILDHFVDGADGVIALAVVWGLTAFFIDNFFSFTFTKPNIAVHGWALLGVFAALYRQARQDGPLPGGRLIPAAGLLACAGSLIVGAVLCAGIFFYHLGTLAMNAGNINAAGRFFVTGSRIDRWSASYPSATGDAAAAVFGRSRQAAHLRLAELNYLEAVRREPLLYANHLMLSRVYLVLGDRDRSLSYAREAKRLSPFEYERDMARITQADTAAKAPAK
ncbi:MAG: O-antigen ligase family protein [Candidatus Omnitrophota bacterium]